MTNALQIRYAGDVMSDDKTLALYMVPEAQAKLKLDPSIVHTLKVTVLQNPELANVASPIFVDYLQKMQLTGADPRRNEIYLIPRKKNNKYKDDRGKWIDNWVQTATVVFAYQFVVSRGLATGECEGYGVSIVYKDYWRPGMGVESNVPHAVAWVDRKGYKRFEYEAALYEFAEMNDDGAMRGNWRKWKMMLEKCGIANAFRRAFPDHLSGVYCAEEMTADISPEVTAVPVNERTATDAIEAHDTTAAAPNNDNVTALDPGAYRIQFGKNFKGMLLRDIPMPELESYLEWLEANASKNGTQLSSEVQALKNAVIRYGIFLNQPAPEEAVTETLASTDVPTEVEEQIEDEPLDNEVPDEALVSESEPEQAQEVAPIQAVAQPAARPAVAVVQPAVEAGPAASKHAKAVLWSGIVAAEQKGLLNRAAAMAKIERTNLTEALVQGLIQQLQAGNASWFQWCQS